MVALAFSVLLFIVLPVAAIRWGADSRRLAPRPVAPTARPIRPAMPHRGLGRLARVDRPVRGEQQRPLAGAR